ncbi:MAG: peptidoglycan DD-metalloendopeptidase family protein [Colwellia sp.]
MKFFCSLKDIFFYSVLSITLFSCSSRDTPAPVSTIYSGSERDRSVIKAAKYTVKKGETLYSIAWRANSDIRHIARLNKLSPPYNIYPGQTLFLVDTMVHKSTKASKGKVWQQKPSKSSKINKKNHQKNSLASVKNQAYGANVNKEKTVQKTLPKPSFSKKIKRWQWPVNGKIIKYFSNSTQGNKGIDIIGSRGTKIRSAAKGKVVYAGNALRGYGKLIIIKHNDDYLSAYAHNDRILVKEQQHINTGDIIANMGDTDANKVMLHFEIRFRGKSVNPVKYLPQK